MKQIKILYREKKRNRVIDRKNVDTKENILSQSIDTASYTASA